MKTIEEIVDVLYITLSYLKKTLINRSNYYPLMHIKAFMIFNNHKQK